MSSFNPEDFSSLLLEPFPLCNRNIHVRGYLGGGNAGYVFRVRIANKTYALKMFKFYDPRLCPTNLKGMRRRARYDNFLVECRANGFLINQNINGKFTPFCYGWIDVPDCVEMSVARKYNVQPFLWDRPPNASNERVRGILFEWVDGKLLSQVKTTSDVADQIRTALKGLHQASMVHGDIRAANILVNDDRIYLIDLNMSVILPHIDISAQKLKELQEEELRDLEIGFAFLSEVPINEGICVADMSLLSPKSLDEVLTVHNIIKHHWWPQRPSSAIGTLRQTTEAQFLPIMDYR